MVCGLCSCFRRRSSSSTNESATADVSAEEQRRGGAVVVEMFSSQGCATSPEAELLISRLGRGDFELETAVTVLAYHVDYWDHLGWKDPFGSSQWTVRQKAYVEAFKLDTMFTPLVVVQGRAHCVGTDQDAILSHIASAPRPPAPSFQATFKRPTSETLEVSITGSVGKKQMDSSSDGGGNVMVALYESGVVTDCSKGENKGRVLANDYVVRRMEKLCTLTDFAAAANPKKPLTKTLTFSLWDAFKSTKCGLSVFIQNSSHHIFGSHNFQVLLPTD